MQKIQKNTIKSNINQRVIENEIQIKKVITICINKNKALAIAE